MALNLTKTYTVKSNAQADVRKAVKKGECLAGEFTVLALSGGFRIVPTADASPDRDAEWPQDGKARWLAGVAPGLARLRANGHAEKIRLAVVAEQEAALADASAAITAADSAAMTEALAASRDAMAEPASPAIVEAVIEAAAEAIAANATPVELVAAMDAAEAGAAQAPGLDPEAERAAMLADGVNVVTLADDGKVLTARVTRRPARFTPGAPAKPDALSPEAVALLNAVVYSPALRDLEPEAKVGKWIAYNTIHESDRPHGLSVRRVPGFMTTLSRRGLVECRAEKAGQYSACVTAAGVAALVEAGR